MGNKYYLAVDIGASSGRHILSRMEDGKIVLEEVYRFWNGNDKKDGHLVWDTGRLFSEIINGMKKCREIGKIPVSMGIDTWAVDYCLLNADDKPVGPCYAYRDSRTEGMDKVIFLGESADETNSITTEVGNSIEHLRTETEQINGFVTLISDIAGQTNLLSLNA